MYCFPSACDTPAKRSGASCCHYTRPKPFPANEVLLTLPDPPAQAVELHGISLSILRIKFIEPPRDGSLRRARTSDLQGGIALSIISKAAL